MKNIILLLFCLSIASFCFGQFGDVRDPINEILSTPFFWEFQKARDMAEESASTFKRFHLNRYSEEEVLELADHYNASAQYFNTVLLNIKRDMLNKDIRRYMVQFPNNYAKQVELDLRHAQEYYANTYQKKLRLLTSNEAAGADLASLLSLLANHSQTFAALFNKVKEYIRKWNEGMIDKYFIEPYKFRDWDEIQ